MNHYEKLMSCVEQVKSRIGDFKPEIGIVLGSGLGELADDCQEAVSVQYSDIDGFPSSTAPGHVGRYVFGKLGGKRVVMMQGRVHLYEGYAPQDVVLPIRLMAKLGISTLILTNAAGGCNPKYNIGDFCVLKDHMTFLVPSPLTGKNFTELGPRFPDMTEVYNKDLRKLIVDTLEETGCTAHEGVYLQFTGPQYETPAEIRYAQTIGADMAGMSTAIEAVAANHMGLRIGGISLVTNKAAGMNEQPLSEQEVIEIGKKSSKKFKEAVVKVLERL